MKYLKLILCFVLAGVLLLTAACGSGGQNGGANASGLSGRYVEADITPPIDGQFSSFLTSDGTIVCFDRGLDTRYDSADGGIGWVESPGPGRNIDRYQNVSIGTLLPDGNLLAYVQGEGLVIIAPDGSSELFPVTDIDKAIEDGEFVTVSIMKPLGSDRLLLSYTIGGMMIQDSRPRDSGPQSSESQSSGPQGSEPEGSESEDMPPQRGSSTQSGFASSGSMVSKTLLFELSTGTLAAELPIEFAMAATADDEYIYHMDMQGNVKAYNLVDGSLSNKFSVEFGGGGGSSVMLPMIGSSGDILTTKGDGGIYALFDRNLLLCDQNGSISSILEGTAYSIGAPDSTAAAVLMLPDGSIIVNMLENMQTNRLYKYAWDNNAEINPDKMLSVWSLEENAFVRAAIAELRKRNPDSYISYEVAMSGDNAVSASDAIKTLNTRLIGGSGPDIIILDGCPEDSYVDKGMLLDLAGLVDTGDIYQNLLAPYVSDGKLYCLPTQFLMPALIGQAGTAGKARTLDDLVGIILNGNETSTGGGPGPFTSVPENERAVLYFEDVEELWDIMWLSAAPVIVRDNELNMSALRSYLEAIKAISDKYELADPDNENMLSMSVGFASGGQTTILPGSLVRYNSMMTNYGAFAMGNLMLLQLMMEREGSELAPFPGLAEGAWRPSTVAGISADTAVSDFAVELLGTMLSVEVQQINYGAGLPVTHSGIAEQMKEINASVIENGREMFDVDIDALISALRERSVNDTALTDMMLGSVEKLCMGKIDVEGAVKEIEQNIKNYLAERA